ncbi:hypothetical protein MASR1M32_41600 [Rhodobacter sp.]
MADNSVKDALTSDHAELYDAQVARQYFDKFQTIGGYLAKVAAEMEAEGRLTRTEARVLGRYVAGVVATFRALNDKYLMTGKAEAASRLTIDRHESGFPVAQELMMMAVDAQQADKHLAGMASEAELKDRMIRTIVGELKLPAGLQFALSQRLYFEALKAGGIFWLRNDPDAQWLGQEGERRKYLVHWAVWDSGVNLPVVYLMDLEDSGKKPLPNDDYRWPQLQQKVLAQSVGGLKLLTIATGFDADFEGLHPGGCGGSRWVRCIRPVSPCNPARSRRCWRTHARPTERIGRWSGRWRIWSVTGKRRSRTAGSRPGCGRSTSWIR